MKSLRTMGKVFLPIFLLLSMVPVHSMDTADVESNSSSPAKSDVSEDLAKPLLGDEEEGGALPVSTATLSDEQSRHCIEKIKDKVLSKLKALSKKERELIGYVGIAFLQAGTEVYALHVNSSYGFPLALFLGQCASILAKDEPYNRKVAIALGIAGTVSIVEKLFFPGLDLTVPAAALGFALHATVMKLSKKEEVSVDIEMGDTFAANQEELDRIV